MPMPAAEIGVVLYPGAQLATVHGLTDLLVAATKTVGTTAPPLRITHWQAGRDGKLAVAWDSHPNGRAARPSHIVVPLTLTELPDPPLMAEITAWLKHRHSEGATLASVCSGVFILAETGLLSGRTVSTHYSCAEQLARQYPDIRLAANQTVVDNGDIMTAGGFLSWFDLGVRLVDRLLGTDVAFATAQRISAEPHMPARAGSFVPDFSHGDEAIARAQRHIHRKEGRALGLADIAREAGLEKRTLIRRFAAATGHTPLDYCRSIRVARAKEWLESTTRPVAAIGWMVGYSDPKAFTRAFRKVTGLSPLAWRRRAKGVSGPH